MSRHNCRIIYVTSPDVEQNEQEVILQRIAGLSSYRCYELHLHTMRFKGISRGI
jgi:hypothetical protein